MSSVNVPDDPEPGGISEIDEASQGIQPSEGLDVIAVVDEASQGIQPETEGPRWAGAYPKEERQKHADRIRRRLAYIIVGVVLALDVLLVGAFIVSAFQEGQFSKEDLNQALTSLAGPNALAAAVVGFYYGNTSDSE